MTAISPNLGSSADHALQYLARVDGIPHRNNQLLDVETQLSWLPELGFEDVDCTWK
jgi:hypothetical protein